jgi:hypothetical protein
MTTMEGLIDVALERHFKSLENFEEPDDGVVYNIDDRFTSRPVWRDFLRTVRFDTTTKSGILYRKNIVTDLLLKVNEAFSMGLLSGVVVKGPHGVGKSHSLVNLVFSLLARGDCLVTFVPDCDKWDNATFLLKMICGSFGSTPEVIKAPKVVSGVEAYDLDQFNTVVDAIVTSLAAKNKYWVFVFDQISRLLSIENKESIGDLRYPFKMVSTVRKPGRVISTTGRYLTRYCVQNEDELIIPLWQSLARNE